MSPVAFGRRGARWIAALAAFAIVVAVAATGCSQGGSEDGDASDEPAPAASTTGTAAGAAVPPSTFSVVHAYESLEGLKGIGKKTIALVDACGTCGGDARLGKALKAVTDELGWELLVTDDGFDLSKGLATFNTQIERGVDAIISASWDPYTLSTVIKKANDADIPFVVAAGDWVPGVAFACCMDPPQMGQMQAAWVYQRLQSKGNVVMFDVPGARDVEERKATFLAMIKLFPNIKIIETQQINFADPTGGTRAAMASLLLKHRGNIQAVWAPWDDPAIGAGEAIDASEYKGKVFVIGNDGGPDARARICGDSAFDGTIYVPYEDWSKALVQELGKIFNGGEPSGRWLFTPQFVLSRHLGNCPSGDASPPSAGFYYSYWTP